MNTHRCDRALVVALLVILASPLLAQSAPVQKNTYWGYLALGAGGASDSGFYASAIGGAAQFGRVIVKARAQSIATKKRVNRMEDVGLLVGFATRPALVHFSVAGGLGIAKDNRDSSTVAVPIEAEATLRPVRWAGIGVRVFSVLNSLTPYSGLTIALQLGRVR